MVHTRDEGGRHGDAAEEEEGGGRRREEGGIEDDGRSEEEEVHGVHELPWAAEDREDRAEGRDDQEEDHTPGASGDGAHTKPNHRPSCRYLRWLDPCYHLRYYR